MVFVRTFYHFDFSRVFQLNYFHSVHTIGIGSGDRVTKPSDKSSIGQYVSALIDNHKIDAIVESN